MIYRTHKLHRTRHNHGRDTSSNWNSPPGGIPRHTTNYIRCCCCCSCKEVVQILRPVVGTMSPYRFHHGLLYSRRTKQSHKFRSSSIHKRTRKRMPLILRNNICSEPRSRFFRCWCWSWWCCCLLTWSRFGRSEWIRRNFCWISGVPWLRLPPSTAVWSKWIIHRHHRGCAISLSLIGSEDLALVPQLLGDCISDRLLVLTGQRGPLRCCCCWWEREGRPTTTTTRVI